MEYTKKLKLAVPGENELADQQRDNNTNFQIIEDYTTALTQVASGWNPSAFSLTTASRAISFQQITKTGFVFSLSSGSIKVSESGFVIVDAHVLVQNLVSGDGLNLDITKNGITSWMFSNVDAAQTWVTIDQTSKLIPVAKNDVLGIKLRNASANRGTLNIEASYINVRFFKDLNFSE